MVISLSSILCGVQKEVANEIVNKQMDSFKILMIKKF